MPPVVSQPTVQIKTPTGQQTVNNPLFQYKFQQFPLNPTYFPPNLDERAKRPFTVRQPESGDPNSPSRPEVINAQLRTGNYMQRTVSARPGEVNYLMLIAFRSGTHSSSQQITTAFLPNQHQVLPLKLSMIPFMAPLAATMDI